MVTRFYTDTQNRMEHESRNKTLGDQGDQQEQGEGRKGKEGLWRQYAQHTAFMLYKNVRLLENKPDLFPLPKSSVCVCRLYET